MNNQPVPIIFDTDMETDCDDVGALCLLHNCQSGGLCTIKAVVCDADSDYIAPSAEVINHWYGRPEIPVGTVRIPGYEDDDVYDRYRNHVRVFEERFPGRLYNRKLPAGGPFAEKTGKDYPDATRLYRHVLSGADDGSVVVCVVGFMTALAGFLKSASDDISPLNGIELAVQKIRRVVSMAVVSPCPGRGDGNFNFLCDLPAARFVVENLPVPLFLSTWGTSITTGERFTRSVPPEHPGRIAYEVYLDSRHLTPPEGNRSSWDQVAALFSILGEGSLFTVVPGFTLCTYDLGFEWRALQGGRPDGYVQPKSEKQMEQIIENLMIGPPDTDF